MPKAKRKMNNNTQSTSTAIRWADRPENWPVAKLLLKLNEKGIILPATLKRAHIIQIYRDNGQKNTTVDESIAIANQRSVSPVPDIQDGGSSSATRDVSRHLESELENTGNVITSSQNVRTTPGEFPARESLHRAADSSDIIITSLHQCVRELKEVMASMQQDIRQLKNKERHTKNQSPVANVINSQSQVLQDTH